jgi:hypothetical protein
VDEKGLGYGAAVEGNELAGETARGDYGDLLAEDGADCDFEAVPAAGGAEAGALSYKGSEDGIAGEMVVDGFDIGTEIEEAADASDDGGQEADVGEADADVEALALGEVGDLDAAHGSVDFDCAEVALVVYDFDSGDGSGAEEVEHAVPVIGRAIA